MKPGVSLSFLIALVTCLLLSLRSTSQYRSEPVSWEKNGTSGYYQNSEGAVFHVTFPSAKEVEILGADKLIPAGTKDTLWLLFFIPLPRDEARLIFAGRKPGKQYIHEDIFWSYQTDSKELKPIEKPLPDRVLNLANIYSFYEKGRTWLAENNPDSAAENFRSGLELSEKLGAPYLRAIGFYNQSLFYIKVNDWDSAQQVLDKALDIFKKAGMQVDIAWCFRNFSSIFLRRGDFPLSLDYGLKALRINEQTGYKPGISRALSNVGNVYLRTGQLDDALTTFNRALSINTEIGRQDWIANSLLNIGASYQKKGVLDTALLNYRNALKLVQQSNDKISERVLLTNIGSLLRQVGETDSSIIYLSEALALARKYDIHRAHLLNDIVETYLQSGQPEEAKNYALLAIAAAEREQNQDQLQFAWLILSRAHATLGDYQSAYNARKEYEQVRDSVYNKDKMKALDQLRIKYETEKKEQVIAELTHEKAEARFRRNTYLISGILVAIILLLLFNRQRMKSRRNRELYEKERELEQMKSVFFSNISHEFRTPLTLILGPIRSLRDTLNEPEVTQQLNVMEHNAQRLLSLIDQLLHLSKLESGKIELSPGRHDIVTLIRGTVTNFSSLAASKKIDLSIATRPYSLVMDFDKEKMETVFINLLSNAFKFTPSGGFIKVLVEMESFEEDEQLVICIQDSGAGILEKDIPHVFNRYYQGKEGQRPFQAGTGIGLAMVKELVQLHGGGVEIFSRHE